MTRDLAALRTAVITTSFPRHADDAAGHFVAAELRELPGAVTVFAPGPARIEAREIDGRSTRVHWLEDGGAFGWPGFAARVREDRRRALGAAGFVCRARRALRAHAPQRVIAHWALPSAWLAPAGAELHVISHGADVRLLSKLPQRQRLVDHLLGRAASWRFVSQTLLEELALALPRPAALRAFATVRPPTVACAVDDARAAALRASVSAKNVYVAVGRLVSTKRVDRIVQHVAERADASLVVVGDGPERAALEAQARQMNLQAHFLGERPRSEALAWIRAADWLCFASEAEGASCVLTEAAALGTPVLSL